MRSLLVASVAWTAALAACTGDAPDLTANDGSVSSSSGAGSSSGAPPVDGAACAGDEVQACGPGCEPCQAPVGGTVRCEGGQCLVRCDDTRETCGASCALLASDPQHCGRCDHDCAGGACVGGACQPVVLAAGPIDRFVLAGDQMIYSGGGVLSRCLLADGCATSQVLVEGKAGLRELAVEAGMLWFFGDGRLWRCALADCVPSEVASTALGSRVLTTLAAGGGHVVWSSHENVEGTDFARLHACEAPTCSTVQTLVQSSGAATPSRYTLLTPLDNAVFLGEKPGVDTNTRVVSRGRYMSDTSTPSGLSGVGEVVRIRPGHAPVTVGVVDLTGGNSSIFDLNMPDDSNSANEITLAAIPGALVDYVEVGSQLYTLAGDVLARCQTTNCTATRRVLATGQLGARQLEIDDRFVYWTSASGLSRIPRD